MTRIEKPTSVYRVELTEYERGCGSKPWGTETLYFDNEAGARTYATDYNDEHNSEKSVPDWYVKAEYRGVA